MARVDAVQDFFTASTAKYTSHSFLAQPKNRLSLCQDKHTRFNLILDPVNPVSRSHWGQQ
jgi:hypothetical protein